MDNKKIKGITIQFGADTTALDKALKKTKDTSVGLNTELKEVNKLLKFDPGNTQLIAQKQKILADSIENTKSKLNALEQVQGEVEKLFESHDIGEKEYREFQRTVVETEQSLKSYKIQAAKLEEEQEKLQKGTKQLNTFFEATGKSLDEFQDILGTKLTHALKDGTANSDDLTVALNKIGKQALGADADLGKMRDALNQIDSGGIDEVKKALQELSNESENTEEALNDIGKGVASGNMMEAAEMVANLGDKVIELGEKALETYHNIDDATNKINARFDETGKVAEDNANLIKRVYESGLGDSMDSVANAVITVRDNLKELNDTELENIVSQCLILEDMFGVDMSESVRGVNALMEHFGMSATDAMDMLVAGTQNGLDKTNELGDNLSEYSGKFAEAGYSAQEYFQLLQNGLDNGAYNLDKVNDAINEVTTRIADGTIADSMSKINEKTGELEAGSAGWSQSVEDVFKQWQQGGATQKQVIDAIVQDIQNTENQQDKLNKAALAFGTMAEDGSMKFISALISVGDNYEDVQGKAAEFGENTTTSAQETEAAMRKIGDALAPIGEDIQEMLLPILEFAAELAEMFANLPGPIREFIEAIAGITAVVAIVTPIITAILAVKAALASLEISLLPIVAGVAIVAAAIAGLILIIKNWGNITDWLSEKWTAFKDWMEGIWEDIAEAIETVWIEIKDFFQSIWETIYGIIEVPLNLIKSIIEGVMYAIYATIYTIWEVIKIALMAAWDWISSKASAVFSSLADFFSNTWNGIKNTVISVWTAIKDTLGGIWDGIKEKAEDVFSTVWNYIKDGFNSLKDTLSGIMKGIANGIIAPIGNAVNGVINGVNWILDKVGSDKQFALWSVPTFATGTGGLPRDTIGIVNDQKGSVYKELIVPPKGDPFIMDGRDVVLPMEKGTKIMPARETKSLLESLPHFANGIGEFLGGIWETVSDFTGNIFDYISHPDKIVQIAIDKFTDLAGIVEPWLSVASGAVNMVFDGVVGFIRDIFDKEMTVSYNPTAGVEQWRSLAEKALRMEGQYSEANLERMLHQIQTESGGNPNAINNWDINAMRGTPSKGLLQVIDPTFRAYARPGYDTNVWDPLSNMLASIRYAVSVYGSIANAYRGVGYEKGIGDIDLSDLFSLPMLDVNWFKDGGILTRPAVFSMGGNSVGVAGEESAEAIAPVDKLKDYIQGAVLDVLGAKNIEITFNITQTMDGRILARQQGKYMQPVLEDIDKLKRMLGGER